MFEIRLTAPHAVFPSTKIQPFNIVESMSASIFAAGERPKFPPTAPDPYAKNWAPAKRDADPKKQYKAIKEAWESPVPADGPQKVLEAFRVALGWGDKAKLSTGPPMIALGEFELIYPTAPFMGWGEVAT